MLVGTLIRVDDISHEGLRQLLRKEDVSFQALRSWKRSNGPDFERKKNRILELYAIADGLASRGRTTRASSSVSTSSGRSTCGRSRAAKRGRRGRSRGGCALLTRGPHGVRHLLCALDVGSDLLIGSSSSVRREPSFSPSASGSAPATRPRCGSASSRQLLRAQGRRRPRLGS